MEGIGVGSAVKKKRSDRSAFRRPRSDSQPFVENHDTSPPSSAPASDNVGKVSSDENNGYDTSSRRKEFNLNQCASRVVSTNGAEGETGSTRDWMDKGAFGGFNGFHSNGSSRGSDERGRSVSDVKRSSEGVLAPANWIRGNKIKEIHDVHQRKSNSYTGFGKDGESWNPGHSALVSDGQVNENKPSKVKLKVGGVTRLIHAKTSVDGAAVRGVSSLKSSRPSNIPRPRPKLILQENSDDDLSPPASKASGLQGVPWKDFSSESFDLGKKEISLKVKMPEENLSEKQTEKCEPVRKSKRVPKRRVLDGSFNDGDEDDEIRYLERLKNSKVPNYVAECEEDEDEGSRKHKRISKVSRGRMEDDKDDDVLLDYDSSRHARDGKKRLRSEKITEDRDYVEEEELASDGEPELRRKKQKKESVDSFVEGKKEISLTSRQRALQSGKDTTNGSSLIEFPNGLPPAPSRKKKEQLSEVEQQLKKAEAAHRRRLQVEKAARESEAEAIRKILGQDSSRKKREDKIKQRRDELAQERAAKGMELAQDQVRWVSNSTGNFVIFPKEVALPCIFDPKPCSYPPPREKCAGPSCTNPYKYRHSKLNIPLCSLQCYKAVAAQLPTPTC
ncbi:hypothetical protein Sjap_006957 [Stephania japonica]|uniref:INO80 complex subunit B-like conserved region domain-containing protein n=1 Tax=Stephania japonica TaxID=461633 RepID=A0AAP0PLK6_9MAGN